MDERSRAPTSSRSLTYAQLALGMATFGSATPVSKIVAGTLPIFVGSGFRVALGAIVLSFAVRDRAAALKKIEARDWWLITLIALFGMFGFSALMG
jgi:hypothetical protein